MPGHPQRDVSASAIRDVLNSATSIASLIPNSVQTFTINAASIAPGGDVQQNVVKNVVNGNEVGSANGQEDIKAPKTGLHTPSTPVEKPNSTTTTSTNVTSDDNKVEPGQSRPRHRKPPAGLAGAVQSVSDRISSSVSKVADGLRGGRAETSKASTGEAETGKASTDGTSK